MPLGCDLTGSSGFIPSAAASQPAKRYKGSNDPNMSPMGAAPSAHWYFARIACGRTMFVAKRGTCEA